MHRTACICIGLLGALIGCRGSQPVDLTAGASGASGGAAILREGDYFYLRAVDGRAVPDRVYARTSRSYLIASGRRTLTVESMQTVFFATVSGGPMEISLVLQPDHVYAFRSSSTKFFRTYLDVVREKPAVVDEKSKETVETVQVSP